MHGPDQQQQLSAVHAVPHEGGQQEKVKESCHCRTGAAIWINMFIKVWNDVGLAHFCLSVVLPAGVVDSREEGDDKGQQADVDAQQSEF